MFAFTKSPQKDEKKAQVALSFDKNRVRQRPKSKKELQFISRVVVPKRALSAAQGESDLSGAYSFLVDPKLIYEFRLVQLQTLTAAVNVLAGYVNVDPTASDEWSSMSGLFSVYRVKTARLTICPINSGSTSTTNGRPWLIVATEVGLNSVTPNNGQKAMDAPNSRIISLMPGMPHENYQWQFTKGTLPLSWQALTGSLEPYAGAWGQFSFYGQTAGASDTVQTAVEIVVEMSGRT